VVATETVYHGEQKVEDLIDLIKRSKKSVNVPVTTGEIWNIWARLSAARLFRRFIAAHVLPIGKISPTGKRWTRRSTASTCCATRSGKRHRIAEFGWPSADTICSRRSRPVRTGLGACANFVTRAEAIGMDYNIVEAIDQPWNL